MKPRNYTGKCACGSMYRYRSDQKDPKMCGLCLLYAIHGNRGVSKHPGTPISQPDAKKH